MRNNKFDTEIMYTYSFFFPVFITLLLFIVRGIYPFGDESFMRTDMYHQYVPFMSELLYKLHRGESLFYTNLIHICILSCQPFKYISDIGSTKVCYRIFFIFSYIKNWFLRLGFLLLP